METRQPIPIKPMPIKPWPIKPLSMGLLLIWLSCIGLPSLVAAESLNDFNAHYIITKYDAKVAKMSLSLTTQAQQQTYRSHSKASGWASIFSSDRITEISQLQTQPTGETRLSHYRYQRKDKEKKNQDFQLDWTDNGTVLASGKYANSPFKINVQGPVWDRLSVQLALMSDLMANNGIEKQKQFSYQVIDRGRLTRFQFQFLGEETLKIGKRSYTTVKFKRIHASGRRSTILWMAREINYLPVRIHQYKKDEHKLSMDIDRYSQK